MSYGYGAGAGQAASKAKPVHNVTLYQSGAHICPRKRDSRNIIAGGRRPRYDRGPRTKPNTGPCVDTRKLDAIDLRILAELQANGRITNVELSRRAKIT